MIRLRVQIILFVSVVILFIPLRTLCGQTVSEPELNQQTAFGVSLSYAPTSFVAWGKMENTNQTHLSLSYLHSQLDILPAPIELSSELIITGHIRYPIDGANGPRESVYGIGFLPIRVSIPFSSGSNRLFLTNSAGFLVTHNAIPETIGTRFNYILELGLGYDVRFRDDRSLQFGYKLHHFSNGNNGIQNPGIDSHMFFVNLLFWD
ncbi:MAG: acyloxyacyl hydrolase [Balneolaceae bacterium]|nr:MAG: acyloxyacyl hydrolase [Balneolaceae bacterium]